MASTRQLKGKIRAVRNIEQITRAMELVSATKMRRSQDAALSARPYAKKSFSLLLHLLQQAGNEEVESVFMRAPRSSKSEVGEDKTALVVITSDKGLAGSFNSAVLRMAYKWYQESFDSAQDKQIEIVAVGKKGRDFFRARGATIAAEFYKFSDIVTLQDIVPLMDWIMEAYEQKKYEKIVFCSQQFISALVQKPEIHQILPLEQEELQQIIEHIVPKTGRYAELVKDEESAINNRQLAYLLEPSAKAILDELVRDLIRVMIMHLIFESNASEHSARMIAMKNATENADRLQEELTLALNKARQAAITQELTEISTAKEALTAE